MAEAEEEAPKEQHAAVGLTPLIVTIHSAENLPTTGGKKLDPFIVVESAGIRSQTDVCRNTTNPEWDQMLTLRCVFTPNMREELTVTVYHEECVRAPH
jgi:Ca2+-dependent lipid-binding protein